MNQPLIPKDHFYGLEDVVHLATGGAELDETAMRRIASEFAEPATCFLQQLSDDEVVVRFFSPGAELPMCGHGTMGLFTWLFEDGHLTWGNADHRTATLQHHHRAHVDCLNDRGCPV